jgi:hypothetical protein
MFIPRVIFYVNILSIDPSIIEIYSHKGFLGLGWANILGLAR